MEEKVKVTYEGKVLEALNKGNSYILRLPSRGNLYGTISNSKDGWKLMEADAEHPDYFFWIKLKKDGTVEYANDLMNRSQSSGEVYNPELTDMGTIAGPTKSLYYVAKQLEGHSKLGIAPIEILDLRYKMMGMALKMLGYQSISQVMNGEPNPDISVMDLNRTVQFIEQYPAFSQYVSKTGYSEPNVKVSLPSDFDKEKIKEQFEAVKETIAAEEAYFASRKEFFTDVRHPMIKPDFCLGMKEKVSPSDWESYSGIIKRLGKMILSFNADLLPPLEKMRVVQAASLSQEEMEHQISLITQIPEMDEALAVESYYFMDEVNALDIEVETDLHDDRTRNSTPGKVMKQFSDELKIESDDRRKAIERRDYYRNVYPYDKSRRKADQKKKEDEDPVYGD